MLVRSVVILLLVFALPLRGLAAAGMPLCHSQTEQHHEQAAHDHHDHGAGHAHAQDQHDGSQPPEAPTPTCSACGASCSAAIAPLDHALVAALSPPSTAIAFFGHEFRGITPPVADRPPLL